MAAGDLRDWNKGDRASAAHLQESVSALKAILSLPGSGVGLLRGGPPGRGRVFDLMIGKIVSGSYTDERYMVTAQYVLGTSLTSDQITTSDLTAVDTEQVTFTVTNLAELAGHTHTLAEGMTVLFMAVYDAAEDANRHCVMCVGGSGATTDYLQNVTTDVGVFDTLNMHSTLANAFEFAAVSASGTNNARADLKVKSGASNRMVLQYNGTNAVWDYVRFHI
jgi:hypothetical protein